MRRRLASLPVVNAPIPQYRWVNDLEGLAAVKYALSGALRVGIDTEWTDGETDSIGDAVIATIQLAVEAAPDGQSICPSARQSVSQEKEATDGGGAEQAFVIDALVTDREYRGALSSMLLECLVGRSSNPLGSSQPVNQSVGQRLLPVGFAFASDARKLARWLVGMADEQQRHQPVAVDADVPDSTGETEEAGSQALGLPASQSIRQGDIEELAKEIRAAVVDVQLLAEKCGLGSCSAGYAGLKATCEHWLHHVLAKEEQQSDWAARPLRPEQVSQSASQPVGQSAH